MTGEEKEKEEEKEEVRRRRTRRIQACEVKLVQLLQPVS